MGKGGGVKWAMLTGKISKTLAALEFASSVGAMVRMGICEIAKWQSCYLSGLE
jgi:hypothetical protein